MIACSNCGQLNDESVRICRYCGTGFAPQARPTATPPQQQYTPPKPYMWAESGPIAAPQPSTPPTAAPVQQPYAAPPANAVGYRCPRCGASYLPTVEKKVSSEGWLIFVLMLFFCFPLFWIGLLMKQEYRVCPVCHADLG
ncbi:MAG TPA: LITAF-like zinc ribbon domain-containing protein [Pyrinomonadaceae bacterium]|jgi:RNA polymerase subunit RPABC4/transcription elongation factor Spt4|nr:LITAF-like zinc ribbon domain-containing protein [Pyrinomonadaceae bacterium]